VAIHHHPGALLLEQLNFSFMDGPLVLCVSMTACMWSLLPEHFGRCFQLVASDGMHLAENGIEEYFVQAYLHNADEGLLLTAMEIHQQRGRSVACSTCENPPAGFSKHLLILSTCPVTIHQPPCAMLEACSPATTLRIMQLSAVVLSHSDKDVVILAALQLLPELHRHQLMNAVVHDVACAGGLPSQEAAATTALIQALRAFLAPHFSTAHTPAAQHASPCVLMALKAKLQAVAKNKKSIRHKKRKLDQSTTSAKTNTRFARVAADSTQAALDQLRTSFHQAVANGQYSWPCL
jgi:hypothetical protein